MELPFLDVPCERKHMFLGLCDWPLSLSSVFKRFIHTAVCISASLLLVTDGALLCGETPHCQLMNLLFLCGASYNFKPTGDIEYLV